ncbi:MAG TPA: hypothetical protein VMY59_05130, partial [Candidatus Thermoplasmatota archaeon]|nr:hypothetical protein [Candidatus Thermoplasmatota archaeon]
MVKKTLSPDQPKEPPNEKEKLITDRKIIAKEAILNDAEPKWLIVTRIKKTDATAKDIVENKEMFFEEEILFETQEPSIWQCNKCKGTFSQ